MNGEDLRTIEECEHLYSAWEAEQQRTLQRNEEQRERQRRKEHSPEWKAEQAEQEKRRQRKEQMLAYIQQVDARGSRLQADVRYIREFNELQTYWEVLNQELEVQAYFDEQELGDINRLETELRQANDREEKNLGPMRQAVRQLYARRQQQHRQEVRRLQEAEQRRPAIDERAAQYDKTTAGISYTEAQSEFEEIKRYAEESASHSVVRKRADQLRSRCEASLKISIANESSGKKTGAIIGGLFGLIGGPITVACFAAAGGILGNSVDEGKQAETKMLLSVLQDLEKFLSGLPEI